MARLFFFFFLIFKLSIYRVPFFFFFLGFNHHRVCKKTKTLPTVNVVDKSCITIIKKKKKRQLKKEKQQQKRLRLVYHFVHREN
jgi:hypothetical protein